MLAQEWLYGPNRVPSEYDPMLEHYLRLPTRHDPNTTAVELGRYAERIVFTEDVPSLLYDMLANRQLSMPGVIGSAKLPYDVFWIEYVSTLDLDNASNKLSKYPILSTQFGALCVREGEGLLMYLVAGMKYADHPSPFTTLTTVCSFAQWPPKVEKSIDGKVGFTGTVIWSSKRLNTKKGNFPGNTLAVEDNALNSILSELVFGIFLVTQPKVYAEDCVKPSPKLSRARARRNKPPLLEYRRIRLHIGRSSKKYTQAQRTYLAGSAIDTESDDAINHRRYHKVMGHFRHYMNAKTTRTVWIEPHYRGDPKLGVTFTEKDVMR